MNWLKVAVLTGFSVFLIACSSGSARRASADPGNASATSSAANSKTQELFAKNCAVCHQPNGEGGTVKLEDQKLKVPSLKSGKALKHSNESMIDQILKGGDGMPAFKEKLNRDDINDLVRFIREELQGNARNPK